MRSRSAICWSGRGPDGSIPSRDEQKALKEVSESIARAIRTVIKREAREQQVAELISANTRRIEALEALLGAPPVTPGDSAREACDEGLNYAI